MRRHRRRERKGGGARRRSGSARCASSSARLCSSSSSSSSASAADDQDGGELGPGPQPRRDARDDAGGPRGPAGGQGCGDGDDCPVVAAAAAVRGGARRGGPRRRRRRKRRRRGPPPSDRGRRPELREGPRGGVDRRRDVRGERIFVLAFVVRAAGDGGPLFAEGLERGAAEREEQRQRRRGEARAEELLPICFRFSVFVLARCAAGRCRGELVVDPVGAPWGWGWGLGGESERERESESER